MLFQNYKDKLIMAKKMWEFKTKNFTVRWTIDRDVLSTQYMEKRLADECKAKVRSGKWKCFQSEVQVVCNVTGIVLGESYLGNSIYENPAEFRDHFGMSKGNYGSYFAQMVKDAIADARKRFPGYQAAKAVEVRKAQCILAVKLKPTSVKVTMPQD